LNIVLLNNSNAQTAPINLSLKAVSSLIIKEFFITFKILPINSGSMGMSAKPDGFVAAAPVRIQNDDFLIALII